VQLTDHISLEEMIATQHRHISNTPTPAALDHLTLTAQMLEGVRSLLGDKPIIVTSGFRSQHLNLLVGGTQNSAHCYGYAADFICPSFGSPLDVVRKVAASDMKWDQLIEEAGQWVHISCDPRMRRDILTAVRGPKGMTYQRGFGAGET
jgi:hypothetical protein